MNFLTASVDIRVDDSKVSSQLARAKSAVTKTVDRIKFSFSRMASSFKMAFKKMVRYAKVGALAIVGALTLSVKAFATFEEQMSNVATMLDEQTMSYMPAYTKALQNMAVEFGEGTATLSKGLYDILSASVAPNKAIQVLTVSVKAAKAGMTDTAVAADAITTILNSYGLAAEEAGRVSDVLFAIVKKGKLTFGELASSIGTVAAIASTANLSFEEVGAAIATMTRAGLRADLAMTSLRAVINTFLKPADEAIAMAREFGFELSSNTFKTIGLTGVLEKLSKANAEQLAAIMPNIRGLAGFAAALKQASQMSEDLDLMLNATGLTQQAYDKMTNTLAHTLRRLWQSTKMAAVQLGSYLAPAIREVTAAMVKWISAHRQEIGIIFVKTILAMIKAVERLTDRIRLMPLYWKRFSIEAHKAQISVYKIADAMTNLDELFAWVRGDTKTYKNEVTRLRLEVSKLEIESAKLAKAYVEGSSATDSFFDNLIENLEKSLAGLRANKSEFAELALLADQWLEEPSVKGVIEGKPDDPSKKVSEFTEKTVPKLQQWALAAKDIWSNLGDVMTGVLDRTSDALTDFITKGKADFNALAESILADLTRMIIKSMMAQAIMSVFGVPTSGFGGGTPTPGLQYGGEVKKTGLAVVHKGERFSGIQGGEDSREPVTLNMNVSAIDAAGTYQFLSRNKRAIATMIQGVMEKGNHPLRRSRRWK